MPHGREALPDAPLRKADVSGPGEEFAPKAADGLAYEAALRIFKQVARQQHGEEFFLAHGKVRQGKGHFVCIAAACLVIGQRRIQHVAHKGDIAAGSASGNLEVVCQGAGIGKTAPMDFRIEPDVTFIY